MNRIEVLKEHELKNLKQVLVLTKGRKPKINSTENNRGFLPYLDIKALEKDKIVTYGLPEKCVLCNENDILMVWDGSRSGLVLKGKKGIVGSTLAKFQPKILIDPDYLFYFLKSKFNFLNTHTKGAAIPHVNNNLFWNLEIQLPSLDIQKKIVLKLDYVLGQLEEKKKGVSELQSIKLKNLKYLSDNFMSYIISKFIPIESYPAYWKSVTLSDIFLIINQKWQPNSKSANLNYIGLENIESNTGKLVNFLPTNSLKIKSSKTHFLKKHVLYGKLRPYLNKILLPTFDGVCSTDILVLEPKSIVLREFLAYFLRSSHVLSKMTQLMYGTKMPRVKIQDLEKLRLGLPSKEEQEKIIRKIQRSENHIHTIKESITTSIEQQEKTLEYLKYLQSSILDKAFSGKLVN